MSASLLVLLQGDGGMGQAAGHSLASGGPTPPAAAEPASAAASEPASVTAALPGAGKRKATTTDPGELPACGLGVLL